MPFQNPYFPAGYDPYGQQRFQQSIQPPIPQPQNYSMPTIHAEIIQINGDQAEAENYPVPTGGTQMMINKAEDKIFIKTVYANNQMNVDVFVKQAPAPEQPQPDFNNFVTKEELEQRLAELSSQVRSRGKKEETVNE